MLALLGSNTKNAFSRSSMNLSSTVIPLRLVLTAVSFHSVQTALKVPMCGTCSGALSDVSNSPCRPKVR